MSSGSTIKGMLTIISSHNENGVLMLFVMLGFLKSQVKQFRSYMYLNIRSVRHSFLRIIAI